MLTFPSREGLYKEAQEWNCASLSCNSPRHAYIRYHWKHNQVVTDSYRLNDRLTQECYVMIARGHVGGHGINLYCCKSMKTLKYFLKLLTLKTIIGISAC